MVNFHRLFRSINGDYFIPKIAKPQSRMWRFSRQPDRVSLTQFYQATTEDVYTRWSRLCSGHCLVFGSDRVAVLEAIKQLDRP